MIQPPDGYELWSPKKGEVFPLGYLYGEDSGMKWVPGSYPGRYVNADMRDYFCRPKLKPGIKADPNPPQLTMDKTFITQRPQWSDLLDLSLVAHEIGNTISALADQTDSGHVLIFAESLDQLIDLLREEADRVLFTDHKGDSDVK